MMAAMSTAVMALILLPAVAGAAGITLLAVGLRGRPANDHPHCRRCGFDLFGRAAGTGVCPECGADLSRPRAIKAGLRHRRGGLVAAGTALLLPAVAAAGLAGYAAARGVDAQAIKPVWWIAWESRSADKATRETAITEWIRRSSLPTGLGSKLTAGQTGELLDRLLDLQADRATPWAPAWGDMMEATHLYQPAIISPERWQRYVRQAFEGTLTLRVRPRAVKGDAFPTSMSQAGVRRGTPGLGRLASSPTSHGAWRSTACATLG